MRRVSSAAAALFLAVRYIRSRHNLVYSVEKFNPERKESNMADVKVTCITKPHPQSPHEHITHLGNPAAGWKWTREQVIESIDAKQNTFYVIDPRTGKRANIGVVRPGGGRAPY